MAAARADGLDDDTVLAVVHAALTVGPVTARSIALFVLAAVLEIGGAWLVWQGLREHRGWLWIGAGVVALGLYGLVAAQQPDAAFGRVLAAYGGVFIAGSLALGGGRRRVPTRPLGRRRRPGLPGRRGADHVRAAVGLSRPTACPLPGRQPRRVAARRHPEHLGAPGDRVGQQGLPRHRCVQPGPGHGRRPGRRRSPAPVR